MSDEKMLIDTNILGYAYVEGPDKHAVALQLMERILRQKTGVVSVQNLAEFSSLVMEKLSGVMDFEMARHIIKGLSKGVEVIAYEAETVAEAVRLAAVYDLHFYDALIAATMEQNGIKTIATENEKDFKKIPWLKVVNPFKQ